MATNTNQQSDQQEEDASDLTFPKEFDNAETLLTSEVLMLLEHRKQQNEANDDDTELSEVFMKTLSYCQRFSKMLMSKKLHRFELAALANLCPETADEAKSLIPSLESRFEDDDIQAILDEIKTHRSFQY
ncbi:DgyrCDS2557 [Dimorphilus gyrociliatus]|uniref:DgyrCDS2557 n=1 Tax=Dimorphilus gyrociliatus TaxID=2664684 RepID=A0A7I8VAV9_9ANNE|nr:DgyrCDS2557 [Dimorphilus gyrociliatus]